MTTGSERDEDGSPSVRPRGPGRSPTEAWSPAVVETPERSSPKAHHYVMNDLTEAERTLPEFTQRVLVERRNVFENRVVPVALVGLVVWFFVCLAMKIHLRRATRSEGRQSVVSIAALSNLVTFVAFPALGLARGRKRSSFLPSFRQQACLAMKNAARSLSSA